MPSYDLEGYHYLGDCAYYCSTGTKCSYECYEEPECVTYEPYCGWVKHSTNLCQSEKEDQHNDFD